MRIFCGILLVLWNIVMDLNDVTGGSWGCINYLILDICFLQFRIGLMNVHEHVGNANLKGLSFNLVVEV